MKGIALFATKKKAASLAVSAGHEVPSDNTAVQETKPNGDVDFSFGGIACSIEDDFMGDDPWEYHNDNDNDNDNEAAINFDEQFGGWNHDLNEDDGNSGNAMMDEKRNLSTSNKGLGGLGVAMFSKDLGGDQLGVKKPSGVVDAPMSPKPSADLDASKMTCSLPKIRDAALETPNCASQQNSENALLHESDEKTAVRAAWRAGESLIDLTQGHPAKTSGKPWLTKAPFDVSRERPANTLYQGETTPKSMLPTHCAERIQRHVHPAHQKGDIYSHQAQESHGSSNVGRGFSSALVTPKVRCSESSPATLPRHSTPHGIPASSSRGAQSEAITEESKMRSLVCMTKSAQNVSCNQVDMTRPTPQEERCPGKTRGQLKTVTPAKAAGSVAQEEPAHSLEGNRLVNAAQRFVQVSEFTSSKSQEHPKKNVSFDSSDVQGVADVSPSVSFNATYNTFKSNVVKSTDELKSFDDVHADLAELLNTVQGRLSDIHGTLLDSVESMESELVDAERFLSEIELAAVNRLLSEKELADADRFQAENELANTNDHLSEKESAHGDRRRWEKEPVDVKRFQPEKGLAVPDRLL